MQLIVINNQIIAIHNDAQNVVKLYGADAKSYRTSMQGVELFSDISTVADAIENMNTVFSKLVIRRTCRTLGLEGKLNTLLASSDEFMSDWTDAQDIDLADPVLLQALQAGTFTEEEINSIKNSLQ